MLAHPELDHLAYMLFDGLYKTLGTQNVLVYPYIKHYQGGTDYWYILPFLKGYTEPPGFVSKHETPEKSFEELACMIDKFDIVYLSSARTCAVKALRKFKMHCSNTLPPLVFCDGEDHHNLNTIEAIKRYFSPVVCFKRELLPSHLEERKDLQPLYPLPFSAITDNLVPDNSEKDIDVLALFGNTHSIREEIVHQITDSELPKKYKIHVEVTQQNPNRINIPIPVQYKQYHELMSRAKINIVARGEGYDTLRRFEAPCYSGMVMSDNIPIITPYMFKDGEHIIYLKNSLHGLISMIEYFLTHDEDREKIGKAGREHCMKYHTTEARARYFLRKIEEHI